MSDFLTQILGVANKAAEKVYGVEASSLPSRSPAFYIGSFVKTALALLGVIFTVLVIYGALSWMLSRGEEEKIEAAKKLIVNSTIGLALAIAGYTLTLLIVDVIFKSILGQGATITPSP